MFYHSLILQYTQVSKNFATVMRKNEAFSVIGHLFLYIVTSLLYGNPRRHRLDAHAHYATVQRVIAEFFGARNQLSTSKQVFMLTEKSNLISLT